MTQENSVIRSLSDEFHLTFTGNEDFTQQLAEAINYLIENDFSRLTQILYKMDINESRLRTMLITYAGQDAGFIIANLLVEREQQKVQSRKKFKRDDNIPEDDKW